jgi:dolichol-phosphate mannosyltransferase
MRDPLAATDSPTAPQPSLREVGIGVLNRLVLPLLALGFVLWNAWALLVSLVILPTNDFGRMYASAELLARGQDMYAYTKATPARLDEKGRQIDLHNMNPPHFHLLLVPLTLLPEPDWAYIVYLVLSAWCLYYCVHRTIAATGLELTPERRRLGIVFALLFCGTAAMLFTGQLTFFLMVPVTLAWLAARRGQWAKSGALVGIALSVKPFLGVLLAYYVWRRHWRAVAACLGACVLCYALGVLVCGWDNHLSWRARLASSEGWAWLPMNASLMGMLTRTLTESMWYVPLAHLPPRGAWLLWLGIGGSLGVLTLLATSRGTRVADVDADFSLLLAASILFCPLGWVYYVWLVLPPLVVTMAAGQARWPRWLLGVVIVAAIWPIIGTRLFQPEYVGPPPDPGVVLPAPAPTWPAAVAALATLTIGNVFFWGLFALWCGLVRDCLQRRSFALAPLAPAHYRVSVVMPVFSETDTVRQIAVWLIRELGSRLHEIIIVQSPRSSEASRAVCQQLAQEYPRVRVEAQRDNPGLGRGVRQGFGLVSGNLVLMIDSDGEMEIETVPRLLAEMERGGHGIVVASRWLKGGGFSGYSGPKYYLNWCFQQFFRWLFWTPLTDLTYGFKLLRAELVHGIPWAGTLHEIACETTLKPVALGIAAGQVPSKWTARTQGVSKNTFWRNFRYVHMALGILWRGVPYAPPAGRTADQPTSQRADEFVSAGAMT